jgi:hypothetical protein
MIDLFPKNDARFSLRLELRENRRQLHDDDSLTANSLDDARGNALRRSGPKRYWTTIRLPIISFAVLLVRFRKVKTKVEVFDGDLAHQVV